MDNKKKEIKAYNGKYVTVKGTIHQLVPELEKNLCMGCELYHTLNCPEYVVDLCTQGYILKKVK